jgi:choline dehydrogenase-like flavoprotein
MRTTSGSWRCGQGLRQSSGLDRQGRRRFDDALGRRVAALRRARVQGKSAYGGLPGANLLDWPITLAEMEPWYAKAETRWASPGPTAFPACPATTISRCWRPVRRKLGYKTVHTGNMADQQRAARRAWRLPADRFCFQGCKSGAKWSTLYTEIPKGEATGNLEVRPNSMAIKIEHDASGKVTGVVYADETARCSARRRAVVAVAGNSIESPRLLLNSASNQFPDGLANSSGQVGPQLHAAHDRQRVCRVRKIGAHVSRHHHGRHHPR